MSLQLIQFEVIIPLIFAANRIIFLSFRQILLCFFIESVLPLSQPNLLFFNFFSYHFSDLFHHSQLKELFH